MKLKRTKIISVFIILMSMLYIQICYCQSTLRDIKVIIVDQKRLYHKADTVKLKLQNLSGKKLWMVVGFEVLNEGNWEEVFYDLDNPSSGVEKIYAVNKQKQLYLLVKKVPFAGQKSPVYRLFVRYSVNQRLSNYKKESFRQFTFVK